MLGHVSGYHLPIIPCIWDSMALDLMLNISTYYEHRVHFQALAAM